MDSYDFVDLLAVERADELFCIRLAVFEVFCRSRLSEIGEGTREPCRGQSGHVVRRSGVEHRVPSPGSAARAASALTRGRTPEVDSWFE